MLDLTKYMGKKIEDKDFSTQVESLGRKLKDVKQYPYRTAFVNGKIKLPRNLFNVFEYALAYSAGHQPDNHTVYEYANKWYMFTDESMIIGDSARIERW